MWPFDWHIYIWPWPTLKVKVKVMHISTVNILQMVTDKININIADKESCTWLSNGSIRFIMSQFWNPHKKWRTQIWMCLSKWLGESPGRTGDDVNSSTSKICKRVRSISFKFLEKVYHTSKSRNLWSSQLSSLWGDMSAMLKAKSPSVTKVSFHRYGSNPEKFAPVSPTWFKTSLFRLKTRKFHLNKLSSMLAVYSTHSSLQMDVDR